MAKDDNPESMPPAPDTKVEKRYFQPSSEEDGAANRYAPGAIPSIKAAASAITWDDFKKVHLQPCVRESYLYAIGAGFSLGGVKLVLGSSIPKACNWVVGGFVGTSIVAYETCQYRRRKEREGMLRAVEIIERKKAEREAKIQERRERLKEEKELKDVDAELVRRKPWYKVW